MSSLAGALEPSQPYKDVKQEKSEAADSPAADLFGDDVEMQRDAKKDDDEQDEPMADLFGEDNEVTVARDESATSPTPSGHVSDGLSSDERRRRQELEYGEEDEPQQPEYEQVLEAAVQIPNIPVPKSSDGNYWVIRMPNFVQVDSKPFHHETYVGPENEDEDGSQAETLREKSMTIKLKVENMVRWRWVRDGNGQYRKQSNSRVIRWSDGSLSLLLGKELFDITQTIDTSGAVARQSLGGSQASASQNTQPSQPATSGPKSQGLTYLVAQHKRAFILQSEAVVTGYMTLRPTGMQSETHRMLVRAVGQKHNKVARLRMVPDPTMDPEREKMELMKLQSKKPKKARSAVEDDGFGGRSRRRSGVSRKRSSDMMWSDEDDDAEIFEGSEDEEGMGSPRRDKKKAVPADQRKGAGDYLPDDFLVADSSEEEGGVKSEGGAHRKKRRRGGHDEEAEEDDLEKLDAKIEEDERKRRRHEPGGSTEGGEEDAGGDEAMDVESEEEDEEEFKVRKAGTGSRKKRAMVDFDEDEE